MTTMAPPLSAHDRAASLRLHRTMPALEGGAATFRPTLIGHDGDDLRDLPVVPQFEILVCRILRGKLCLLRSNWRIF